MKDYQFYDEFEQMTFKKNKNNPWIKYLLEQEMKCRYNLIKTKKCLLIKL